MGWHQRPKIVEQNKGTSSKAMGMVVAETRGRVAALWASGSLPWIGVDPQNHTACKQNTQSDCRKLPTFSLVVLENSPEPKQETEVIHYANDLGAAPPELVTCITSPKPPQ